MWRKKGSKRASFLDIVSKLRSEADQPQPLGPRSAFPQHVFHFFVCRDSSSVGTVSTVSRFVEIAKQLKQFGSPRSTSHPSEEGC